MGHRILRKHRERVTHGLNHFGHFNVCVPSPMQDLMSSHDHMQCFYSNKRCQVLSVKYYHCTSRFRNNSHGYAYHFQVLPWRVWQSLQGDDRCWFWNREIQLLIYSMYSSVQNDVSSQWCKQVLVSKGLFTNQWEHLKLNRVFNVLNVSAQIFIQSWQVYEKWLNNVSWFFNNPWSTRHLKSNLVYRMTMSINSFLLLLFFMKIRRQIITEMTIWDWTNVNPTLK